MAVLLILGSAISKDSLDRNLQLRETINNLQVKERKIDSLQRVNDSLDVKLYTNFKLLKSIDSVSDNQKNKDTAQK